MPMIGRRLGLDVKTAPLCRHRHNARAYLTGQRQPGQRTKPAQLLIDSFLEYCRLRLGEDPHL